MAGLQTPTAIGPTTNGNGAAAVDGGDPMSRFYDEVREPPLSAQGELLRRGDAGLLDSRRPRRVQHECATDQRVALSLSERHG